MNDLTKLKEKYAELILKKCLSIKPGEPLVLSYSPCHKEFANIIKQVACTIGIIDIREFIIDQQLNREILLNSTIEEIKNNKIFDRSIINKTYLDGGSLLSLYSTEPNMYKGIENQKIITMNKISLDSQGESVYARGIYKFPWCIAATPTQYWADIIFPNEPNNLNKLWRIILQICLIDLNNPINMWTTKIEENSTRKELLTNLKLKLLRYKNNLGTNLEIRMPENSRWLGTEKLGFNEKKLIVNMPTEEVFSAPDRNSTNGRVVSSKPLLLNGNIIEQFILDFENGKVTNVEASNNIEILLELLEKYEGLKYLGECAFVDSNSIISKSNILFYNALLDENAASHLALGKAYPLCIDNGDQMNKTDLLSNGLNICERHIDFMIGTDDLSVVGEDIYGDTIWLIENGNFETDNIKEFLLKRKK